MDCNGSNVKTTAVTITTIRRMMAPYHSCIYFIQIDELEAISTAATKEHTLESNMQKMQAEWKEIQFTFVPYRDTGTHIISGIDDIQVHTILHFSLDTIPYSGLLWREKKLRFWPKSALFFPVNNFSRHNKPADSAFWVSGGSRGRAPCRG